MSIHEVSAKMIQVYHKIQDCVKLGIDCDDLRNEYDSLNREWNRLYRFL
jgi:hypothetical protein